MNKFFAISLDFLRHCRQTVFFLSETVLLSRDKTITRPYEQGAFKEQQGVYLRRWLGWVIIMVVLGGCTESPKDISPKDISAKAIESKRESAMKQDCYECMKRENPIGDYPNMGWLMRMHFQKRDRHELNDWCTAENIPDRWVLKVRDCKCKFYRKYDAELPMLRAEDKYRDIKDAEYKKVVDSTNEKLWKCEKIE